MSFSIIIPTIGRPSLEHTLLCCLMQLKPEDEIIIVTDGPCAEAFEIIRKWQDAWDNPSQIDYIVGEYTHTWGHAQRNRGMEVARNEYLMFIDDDDTHVPGALEAVRQTISYNPNVPLLFQFLDKNGARIWHTMELREGNVGTPCIVVPNVKEKLGEWGSRYEGDFDFIKQTCELWGNTHIWVPRIIVDCRV